MTNRIRAGFFLGVTTLIASVGVGCSAGSNSTDTTVPSVNVTRNIAGNWRRYQIGYSGTRVTCPDPADLLAPSTRELTVNSLVVDTCASGESLLIGAPSTTKLGTGRYRLTTRSSVEDGSYALDGTTLTLTRDIVNGTALKSMTPAQAPQRTVYTVTFDDTEKTISIVPVSQPVALTKVDGTKPVFREDGTLIVTNVTPVLNTNGSINTIVIPGIDDDTVVNSDLSISIGPLASSGKATETPGFVRVRAVNNVFKFVPEDPSSPNPTPAPAP